MKISYVVLYVKDPEACLTFWTEKVGMEKKSEIQAGEFTIAKVGFADQDFAFELVPLDLMKDNPDGLDLATPSIAFNVKNLEATHSTFNQKQIETSEIADHSGMQTFGFCDNEGRWFAVISN